MFRDVRFAPPHVWSTRANFTQSKWYFERKSCQSFSAFPNCKFGGFWGM